MPAGHIQVQDSGGGGGTAVHSEGDGVQKVAEKADPMSGLGSRTYFGNDDVTQTVDACYGSLKWLEPAAGQSDVTNSTDIWRKFPKGCVSVKMTLSRMPGVLVDLERTAEPFWLPTLGGESPDLGGAPNHIYQIQQVWELGTTLVPWEPALWVRQITAWGGTMEHTQNATILIQVQPGFDKCELIAFGSGRGFPYLGCTVAYNNSDWKSLYQNLW